MDPKFSEPYEQEYPDAAFDERYIPLAEACHMFPNGRVSRASLERWWRTGVRGAVLQTYLVGHRRYTTLASIKQFIEDQQVDHSNTSGSVQDSRREGEINKAEANVRRQLGQ